MRKNVLYIIFFVCSLAVGSGAWYFLVFKNNPSEILTPVPAPNTTIEVAPGFAPAASTTSVAAGPLLPPRTPPAGFKEYRNTMYRFALLYPANLSVQEFDEGGGARTIIFQNEQVAQGFQIFVVPYSATQVSTQRFKADQPSGVIEEPHNIAIDGAFATIFFGKDALLGETREVWFIHAGYLFEVTTPKVLDDWLGTIMQTWIFI